MAHPSVLNAIDALDVTIRNGSAVLESFNIAIVENPNGTETDVFNYKFTYTVKAGDNLSSIAEKFGTTVDEIESQNGLKSTNINEGQKIEIAATVTSDGSTDKKKDENTSKPSKKKK